MTDHAELLQRLEEFSTEIMRRAYQRDDAHSLGIGANLANEAAAAITALVGEVGRLKGQPIDIVFDGPPGPEPGRFVEVENAARQSIRFGEWVKRPDGYWALRFNAALSITEAPG